MKKIMSLFSSCVFLVSCCAGPLNDVSSVKPQSAITLEKEKKSYKVVGSIKKIKYLTVKLNGLELQNFGTLCSAVWIKQGVLLTANHCVKESILFSYSTLDDTDDVYRLAAPFARDEKNDLAILYVDPVTEPPHDIAVLSDIDIESGESVDIVGHTVGLEWTYSKGYVAAIRTNMLGPGQTDAEKVIQISSPAWMGNSGGGAFDDGGSLIGLCSWISTSGPFLTFFIHRDTIKKFLKREHVI